MSLTKYDNDVLFWDGWCPSETPPPPPTSYKWFSKWFQLLGQSGGEVHSTIADTIAILQIHSEKFNICSCQGIVLSRPHKICWMIFSYFWHFMWGVWRPVASLHTRFISIQSVAGCHIENVFMFQRWCVCGANIFWSIRNIFCCDLKIFFSGNHSDSGAIIRDCLETRARPPIEFFHCANTEWKYRKTLVFNSLFG